MVPNDAQVLLPGFENMLPYVAKGTLQIWLRTGDGKIIILDYLRGARCSHSSDKWKKEGGEEDSE